MSHSNINNTTNANKLSGDKPNSHDKQYQYPNSILRNSHIQRKDSQITNNDFIPIPSYNPPRKSFNNNLLNKNYNIINTTSGNNIDNNKTASPLREGNRLQVQIGTGLPEDIKHLDLNKYLLNTENNERRYIYE